MMRLLFAAPACLAVLSCTVSEGTTPDVNARGQAFDIQIVEERKDMVAALPEGFKAFQDSARTGKNDFVALASVTKKPTGHWSVGSGKTLEKARQDALKTCNWVMDTAVAGDCVIVAQALPAGI